MEEQYERIVKVVYESLKQSRQGSPPPDAWLGVLRGCLQGKTYSAIEDEVGFAVGSAKDCANTNLWPLLTKLTGEKVGKLNCRTVLANYLAKLTAPEPALDAAALEPATVVEARSVRGNRRSLRLDPEPPSEPRLPLLDTQTLSVRGGAVPLGRDDELSYVVSQIQQNHRFIFVYGLPGSHKTNFGRAIASTIQPAFDYPPVWCQAEDVLTPDALYNQVCAQTGIPETGSPYEAALPVHSKLRRLLRQHSLLVVIDHTDALYSKANLAGSFNETSRGYQQWLSGLLTEPFYAGCLLWIGQALPQCVQRVSQQSLVYCHGMWEINAAAALFPTWKQRSNRGDWQALLDFCGGCPGLIAAAIQQVEQAHRGSISAFLQQPEVRNPAFAQKLRKLMPAEQTLLLWMGILPPQRSPRWEETGLLPGEQEAALASLQRRCLLRWREDAYCYRLAAPIFRPLLATFLVGQMIDEFRTGQFYYLCRYPLLMTDISSPEQAWQRRHLLIPATAHLRRLYPDLEAQHGWLKAVLNRLGAQPQYGRSYAAGNTLNIAIELGLSLMGVNLSGLTIRQVDLQGADVNGLVTRSGVFENVLFPTGLVAPLRAAITPGGRIMVVGDRTGRVTWWQRNQQGYQLVGFQDLSHPIDGLVVTGNRIAVAIADTVYCWWWNEQSIQSYGAPPPIDALLTLTLPAPVTCLAFSHDPAVGYLAMGLRTGQIALWDFFEEKQSVPTPGHVGYVTRLHFNAQGTRLASIGGGNSLRCWSISEGDGELQFLHRLEPNFDGVFVGLGWRGNDVCALEYLDQFVQVVLRVGDMDSGYIPGQRILAACFSKDGKLAAGKSDLGKIHLWDMTAMEDISPIQTFQAEGHDLQLTDAGEWLLLSSDRAVQVWHLPTGECLWTLQAHREHRIPQFDLQGADGVPPVYQQLHRAR